MIAWGTGVGIFNDWPAIGSKYVEAIHWDQHLLQGLMRGRKIQKRSMTSLRWEGSDVEVGNTSIRGTFRLLYLPGLFDDPLTDYDWTPLARLTIRMRFVAIKSTPRCSSTVNMDARLYK